MGRDTNRIEAEPAIKPGLVLVLCSFGANGLIYGSLLSRYAEIADTVHAGEAAFGLALAVGALGGLAGSLVAPLVVRALGESAAATACGCTFAVLTLGAAGSQSLAALAIALFVMTAVDGAHDVSMNALAVRVQQRAGTSVLGRAHAVWSLSLAAGTGLGAAAAGLHIPILGHVGAVATALVVVLLAASWTSRQRLAEIGDPGRPDSEAVARTRVTSSRGPVRTILVTLAIAAIAASYVESPGQEWTALLLGRGFNASPGVAASGPLAFSTGLLVSRLPLDLLTRRFGRSGLAMAASATIVTGTLAGLLVGLVHGPVWGVLVTIAVAGFGAGPIFPLLFGAADLLSSRYQVAPAKTASVVSALSRTGAITAPAVVGALTSATTLLMVFLVMASGGLMVMATLPRTWRRTNPGERTIRRTRQDETGAAWSS